MSSPDPQREPSAAARRGAREVRELFLALCAEGFTEAQALVVVGQVLRAALGGGGDKP